MPKAHGAAVSPENLHALLLSTDRKTVDNVRTALVALGYRVRASRDIATGIRRFRLTSPDLLIIDAQLLERRVPENVVGRFHVWRRHGHTAASAASDTAKLTFDPTNLTVHIGDRVASLTHTEFAILFMLMSHCGKAVTRDELLDAVKHEGIPFDRVVDRHICNIRHKIDLNPDSPSLIETVRGIGYRIDADD